METEETDVLIVGAGIGGLTLGLLLGEKGYRVAILDQRNAVEPLYKPELIQPAGLTIFHALGVLDRLQRHAVSRCDVFEFRQVRGRELCRVDYRKLAHPFPYALIAFPHITQATLAQRLADYSSVQLRWRCTLSELAQIPDGSVQAVFGEDGRPGSVSASVVVGADGRSSRVRERAGIRTVESEYDDAFVTIVAPRPASYPGSVRYYLGRRQILGIFPVKRDQLCLLFMVPAKGFEAVKDQGLNALKEEIAGIDGEVAAMMLDAVTGWEQASYMTCRRVWVSSWVKDGIVLIGDAAHACHPHVAQGSTQAMLDAVALQPVLSRCLEEHNFTAERLSAYEASRRPAVDALQRIADDYAWIWNTGNPLLMWIRDRAFHQIGQRPRLLAKVVETEAGLRVAPLTISERLQALGVLP